MASNQTAYANYICSGCSVCVTLNCFFVQLFLSCFPSLPSILLRSLLLSNEINLILLKKIHLCDSCFTDPWDRQLHTLPAVTQRSMAWWTQAYDLDFLWLKLKSNQWQPLSTNILLIVVKLNKAQKESLGKSQQESQKHKNFRLD